MPVNESANREMVGHRRAAADKRTTPTILDRSKQISIHRVVKLGAELAGIIFSAGGPDYSEGSFGHVPPLIGFASSNRARSARRTSQT